MNTSAVAFCAVVALQCLVVGSAQAQPMRCKNDLAQVGDGKASVLQKCGEPASKDSFCKPVSELPQPAASSVNVLPCERVDEWTYLPGYGQFVTTLRFEAGTLRLIKYGDRVK